EEIAVHGIRIEVERVSRATGSGRALRERERDERLRADLREAVAERLLARAGHDDVLRFGEEERTERDVFGLEAGRLQTLERADGGARLFERARAAQSILEAAREELRRSGVRREDRGAARAFERCVGVARARCRLRAFDEHLAPDARLLCRMARELRERVA